MLATAAPPGFGLVRPFSTNHTSTQRIPLRAPNAIHPTTISLLEQQAMMLGGLTGNTGLINSNEEISTIFVVGFPDDMQEREFQNMFIFSLGFEAATLKIPSYTQEDVDVINGSFNNTRKQIIGFAKFRSRLEALEARDILSGRKVDAEKGSVLKAEMAKKNLHTKRGLSNDQSCSGSYPLISPSVASTRKGFQPTSAYDAFYSVPACVPALPSDLLVAQDYAYEHAYGNGCTDHFSPPIPASSAFGDVPFCAATQLSNSATVLETKERIGGLVTVQRSHSAEELDLAHSQQQLQLEQQHQLQQQQQQQQIQQQQQQQPQQPQQTANSSRIMASYTPSQMSRLNTVKSLLDLPDLSTSVSCESGTMGSRSLSDLCSSMPQSAPPTESRGFHSALFGGIVNTSGNNTNGAESPNHGPEESAINVSLPSAGIASGLSRFAALSINTAAANNLQNSAGTFVNSPSTILSPGYLPSPGLRSSNAGDQNPPCNTLYVGNLPANTNEEELRLLFSKCVGYKRMCFRTKANGPMCFVEFDDVMCATQALHDLYGNPLSNSVKGGIRLSYSKNPLGVRQHPTFPSPVSVPNGSMYIPNGPLSAPPTTTTPPFGAFTPVTRDIMGSAAGPYGSSLRESAGNGYASSLLREGMTIERTGSASSVGTIGQPAIQQPQNCGSSAHRPAVNNNMVASFGIGASNSVSPVLVPVATTAGINHFGKSTESNETATPGSVAREILRTLSFETVSAFLDDDRMDPSPVKVEYEPLIAIEYPPIIVDGRTEFSRDGGAS